ncbi:hypothetical protein Slala03_61810 [Streptomyces lavendulae subsp. lavendulae]|uniref:hypothetical protein n=1 Tax=Streptomyces lavendulae TaxID=1914 RepID=UPI0024A07E20|nr:hypothetical protein [Streptomyces lavendulae]GLV86492.1 hypothetical protein Slala03_61810 [Streptomyces lavendulae subsp. lavendulae]
MHSIAVEQQRGHVLLIAGDAAVRRRAVQVAPSANLAALGVVPVPVLLDSTVPSDTTYLDGARDPNTVLTRLRTAAATPGPLLVYLSGRLTVDRRGRRLHLCLAGTTAASVRHTGLPWEWLGSELRERPAGLTTVLLDLAADKAAWPLLQEYGSLPAPPSVEVYGVVAPPGFAGGGNGVSGYTRQWIEQLRSSPGRPDNLRLHALAVGAAALPPGTLVLPTARELAARPAQTPGPAGYGEGPERGRESGADGKRDGVHAVAGDGARELPGGGPDPRPHIHALATAGRHAEADALAQAWEAHVLRAYGPASPEATHWTEIRADLARMAGDFRLATRLWTGVGVTRLARQSPDAPEVKGAAAGALYCWTQLKDRAAAAEAGPELIRLLGALPSLDPRHLELARQRLELLRDATPIGR